MIDAWIRATPRAFTLSVASPNRYMPVHLTAVIREDKQWHLFINNAHVAAFQTFEELDGMVPVLVNGYLNRSDE